MTHENKSQAVQLSATPSAGEQTQMILSTLKEIAAAPDAAQKIEVMRAVMDMQRQLAHDQAERSINESLANLDIPHVKKNGKIPLPDKASGQTREVAFAKWEDIDTVIRPLLRSEGLSLSFTAPARAQDGGGATMTGRLSHRDGAFRTAEISLPLDSGPGRNNLQAMGSTISYGKKYLAFMLLNIVTEGEDDDAQSLSLITAEQIAEIEKLLKNSGADRQKFLAYVKATNIESIKINAYGKAIKSLQDFAKQNAKKGN